MVKRYVQTLVEESLKAFPAVILNGARQSGKSTLAHQLQKEGTIKEYVTLDHTTTLNAAESDPESFIERFPESVVIDEVQRAPKLMLAIKKAIDDDRRPGRFLLTGSANVLSRTTESLAGRMDIITLEGLSFGELSNLEKPSSFVKDLFSGLTNKDLTQKWTETLRAELNDKQLSIPARLDSCAFFGSFPEVCLKENIRFRERWYAAYQAAYIERDVRDMSQGLDIVSFSKLFQLAGLRTGQLINYRNLGGDAHLDQRTVTRYMEILQATFQMNFLKPWSSNMRKRFVKTEKLHLNDAGLACFFYGMPSPLALEASPFAGAIRETWVWGEIRKLLTLETGIQSYFYRTHQGKEVDFVLCKGNDLCGLEFKSTKSISSKDFAGLEDFCDATGENARGIILYLGDSLFSFSPRLMAVPIDCLLV